MMIRPRVVVVFAVLAAGCQTEMPRKEQTRCMDPRPEICTREYLPVCASFLDRTERTFANGCEACADGQVISYLPGACD